MKYLLLLILSGYAANSSGQTKEEYYDHNWKKCAPVKAFFSAQIIPTDSGFVVKDYYTSNGQLQMVGKYADADRKIKDGHFTYYFTDGTIASEGLFQQGRREGLRKTYHANSRLKSLEYFQNNKAVGVRKFWHSNGQLEDSIYPVRDTLMMRSWFSNGAVSGYGPAMLDSRLPTGNWTYYRMDGTKCAEIVFEQYPKVLSEVYFDENEDREAYTEKRSYKAYFNNSTITWDAYKKQKLTHPAHVAISKGKKKIVVVGYLVDENGRVKDVYIKVPLHPEYDKIALALFEQCPQWIPSIHYNRYQRTTSQLYTVDFEEIKKWKQKS